MKLITVNDDKYLVRGTVSLDQVTDISTDQLKSRYSLADAVLRNGDILYICSKLIDAEFTEIK